VITDMGVLEPDVDTKELMLVEIHPGVSVEDVRESTGWDLKVAPDLQVTPTPTEQELTALRTLTSR
jgi:glutaconate CoA-transferase subunit B